MKKVGTRELKANLSAYLQQVREGEVIYVTSHGQVVAELKRPSAGYAELPEVERRIQEAVDRGVVRRPTRGKAERLALFRRVPRRPRPLGWTQKILDELREDKF